MVEAWASDPLESRSSASLLAELRQLRECAAELRLEVAQATLAERFVVADCLLLELRRLRDSAAFLESVLEKRGIYF